MRVRLNKINYLTKILSLLLRRRLTMRNQKSFHLNEKKY